MGITFRCPSLEDVEKVRQWRNQTLVSLRTPYPLTREQQEHFYHNIVCDRNHNSRWWSVYDEGNLVGFAGITDIEWENRLGQISLIVDPEQQGKGYGKQSLAMLLEEGFGNLGLLTIYGECYECNPAIGFWEKMFDEQDNNHAYKTMLPNRKRWNGRMYNAMYFSFLI